MMKCQMTSSTNNYPNLTETDIELHTQLCTYYVLVLQCPHLSTSEIVDLVEDDQPWCLTQLLAVRNGSQLQTS